MFWADEFRIALHGPGRRVWAPRGETVRQQLDVGNRWGHLALAVNPLTGQLLWQWLPDLKGAAFVPLVEAWQRAGVTAVVWDGFRSHRYLPVQAVGLVLVEQPPHAPELNPVERVGQELRAHLEGVSYGALEQKQAAAEALLREWATDPARLRRLTGWSWIREALEVPA